jgi:hypothetical protein
LHKPVLLTGLGHLWLHTPQCSTDVLMLVSHPFASLLSQQPNPPLQWSSTQLDDEQTATALVNAQALPQKPQFATDEERSASQVWLASFSQSSMGGVHDENPHCPEVQIGVPPAVGQTCVHVPQCFGSLFRSPSQPFFGSLSQSSKPESQAPRSQLPWVQSAVAWEKEQALPHTPQLDVSDAGAASQPFFGSLSQSSQSVPHVSIAQASALQSADALVSLQAEHDVAVHP